MARTARPLLLGSTLAALLLVLALGCDQGGKGGKSPGSMIGGPPRVTAIEPGWSTVDGGGLATVRGSGFQAGAEVLFGSTPSPRVTRLSTAELEAEIPAASAPGPVDIVVRNPSGEMGGLKGLFRYEMHPPPQVLSVSPATGNARRKVPVEVSGSAFRPGARLFFGSLEIEPVSFLGADRLAAELPPLPPGVLDVIVENLDGQRDTLPGGYQSALMRDTPIAGLHVGRLADLLDESLEPSEVLTDQVVRPDLEGNPSLWRVLPDDPLSGKARIQILAPRGSQTWQEALELLGRELIPLAAWGWAAPGKAPVLPRDGVIRVLFDGDLGVGTEWWREHPESAQLLAIEADPLANPSGALRELPCRRFGSGSALVLVPLGPLGLPPAPSGSDLATLRVAFPLEGPESVATLKPDGQAYLSGRDLLGRAAVVRDLRAAREGENLPGAPGGLLERPLPTSLRASIPVEVLEVDPGGRIILDKLGHRHAVDRLETLLQEGPGGKVALLVRASADTPGEPLAVVEVAGASLLAPGPARLACSYRHGVDDGLLFLGIDPPPGPGGLSPLAGFELDFGEPVGGHLHLDGWVLSTEADPGRVADPKRGTPGLIPVRLQGIGLEASGLFTGLRITPLLGLPHRRDQSERYTLHLLEGGAEALRSLSGRAYAEKGFIASFSLDPAEPDLPAVYLVRRFLAADEDGTPPDAEAPDWWGAGQVNGGRLHARPFSRFQARTEPGTLAGVVRGGAPVCLGPFPLYRTVDFDFLGKGGLAEPFVPGGSRLQATWREDDLGLSRTDPGDMHLELEGLALAPFDPGALVLERLDALTLEASHAARRPDLRPRPDPGSGLCQADPASFESGLEPEFAANRLHAPVRLLDRTAWLLDPAALRLDPKGRRWLPLPPLARAFVFRDLLLETLGGALSAAAPTLDLESPWAGLSDPRADGASFSGNRIRDHHPVALPLLLDFFVPPADPWSPAPFQGANRFRAAHVLPPWPTPGHGLYAPLPAFRAHTSAGPDREKDPPVDPFLEKHARGGFEWDGFLGTRRVPHPTPATDDHLPWLQIDLIVRTTVITFGFVDLTAPGQNAWEPADPRAWPGTWRPVRFLLPDPSDADLPPGTALEIQWRGAHSLENARLWDPLLEDDVPRRGNLLNPLYACDADRLAARGTLRADLTPWVADPGSLLDPITGLGPRYLCWRVILRSAAGVPPPALQSLVLGALLAEGW